MDLDGDKTRKLIERYNESAEKDVIFSLSDIPDLQLKLLEKILESKRMKNEKVEN